MSAQDKMSAQETKIALVTEELFSVGRADGDDWETFAHITALAFAEDGGLYILDGPTAAVTRVDRAGNLVRRFGRRGSGPGEFGSPVGITVMTDGTLVVNDLGRGFHLYDDAGNFLRLVSIDVSNGPPGPELWRVREDLVVALRRPQVGAASYDQVSLTGYSLRDGTSATLLAAEPRSTSQEPEGVGEKHAVPSMNAAMPKAFAPSLRAAVLSDGSPVATRQVTYEVSLMTSDGEELVRFGRDVKPLRVTEGRRQAELERRLQSRTAELELLGPASGINIQAVRSMMAELADRLEFADEIPVVSGIAVDRADRIWVKLYGEDVGIPGPTDIYTRAGEYVGTIPPDAIPQPNAFGPADSYAFVSTDQLGVASVSVVRLSLGPIDAADGNH